MANQRELLRTMTFSAYDLQKLRIQVGLRLCANFRSKLAVKPNASDEELDDEAVKIIYELKDSYRRLTDGIVARRKHGLPAESNFVGDALISTYTELVLVDQYVGMEEKERLQFAQLSSVLAPIPVYDGYLKDVRGIGPAMAAVLISYFDPYKAERISDFWAYAGFDVAPDGAGRSRREAHLIDREYVKANGSKATRKSVTYNPWLKSRLMGGMAASFMRTPDCPWRKVYNDYKHRLMTDPNRQKVTLEEYKKLHKTDPTEAAKVWPPLRIHRASLRYMIKMFLAEFWVKWREIEGLPVTPTYHEAKMGYKHVA